MQKWRTHLRKFNDIVFRPLPLLLPDELHFVEVENLLLKSIINKYILAVATIKKITRSQEQNDNIGQKTEKVPNCVEYIVFSEWLLNGLGYNELKRPIREIIEN